MAQEDYYALLGVEKTVTAEDLKKAYRKKAVQFHLEYRILPSEYLHFFSSILHLPLFQ